jgi:hypothetical protein
MNKPIKFPIPIFYNLPMKPLASFGVMFNVTDCMEWYMYQFDSDVPQEDRDYFGQNSGVPLKRHESSGMLKGGQNILETPCYSVNRTVPYFVEIDEEKEGNINQVVYDEFTKLL